MYQIIINDAERAKITEALVALRASKGVVDEDLNTLIEEFTELPDSN
jgi:hypothetical protein